MGIRPDEFTRIEVKVTLDQESFAQNGERAGVEIRIKLAELEFTIATYPVFFFADYSQYVSDRIFYDVFGVIAFGLAWRIFRNPIYIPAARTGLMLSLSSLIDEAMDYSGEDRSIDLPLPLAQFLQRMQRSNLRPRLVPGPSRDLLNDKMIDGQLTSKRGPIREYRYTPRGLDKSLPLHAVSSMVTELVPLAIDLRSSTIQRHIVFEEPEAHLHLEAQRDMARVIARLLAEGNFVTLTTHSDTFLQQINNLMALHNHARKKELLDKFGYTEFDTIDPNMAKAHEFCPSMDGTTVRQLDHTSEGFIVPTLNETLLSLAKETIELRG